MAGGAHSLPQAGVSGVFAPSCRRPGASTGKRPTGKWATAAWAAGASAALRFGVKPRSRANAGGICGSGQRFGIQAAGAATTMRAMEGPFPKLCVFDLDACLWDKEMFEMEEIPSMKDRVMGDLNGRGEGVVGVMSGTEQISLHPGSLLALQEHADGMYPGMRVALASSADTPFAVRVGRAALSMLEVLPGLTIEQLLLRDWDGRDVNQIGRSPPLSSDKSRSHFPRLKDATGVRFDKMLFFDDCLWGDHCGKVATFCKEKDTRKGVVTLRTPRGLGVQEWREGIDLYKSRRQG